MVRAKRPDRTLHLPRILCLHGGGTNAAIFRMQCRALESKLAPYFRLVYADGPYETTATPDVEEIFGEFAPFRSWFRLRLHDPEYPLEEVIDKMDKAMARAMAADDAEGATGEWVALMGFSQGGRLAASMIYTQQAAIKAAGGSAPAGPRWRFGVLMCAPSPIAWLNPDLPVPEVFSDAAHLPFITDKLVVPPGHEEHLLTTPTIHVHGIHDPDVEWHRRLHKTYTRPDTSILIEWDGDHRVPIKPKDVDSVVKAILLLSWKTGVMETNEAESDSSDGEMYC